MNKTDTENRELTLAMHSIEFAEEMLKFVDWEMDAESERRCWHTLGMLKGRFSELYDSDLGGNADGANDGSP